MAGGGLPSHPPPAWHFDLRSMDLSNEGNFAILGTFPKGAEALDGLLAVDATVMTLVVWRLSVCRKFGTDRSYLLLHHVVL